MCLLYLGLYYFRQSGTCIPPTFSFSLFSCLSWSVSILGTAPGIGGTLSHWIQAWTPSSLCVFSIHFHLPSAAAATKSLQLLPTLCDPIDGSPPGSPVPGILQARTLEWVAISFSNARMYAKLLQSCPTISYSKIEYKHPVTMHYEQVYTLPMALLNSR